MNYDVAIIGSGIVGATIGLALARKTPLKIALIESTPPKKQYDSRVSAISLASKRILQKLDCFPDNVSPYVRMEVWESEGSAKIEFDSRALNVPALGYIIEDHLIRESLIAKFSQYQHLHFLCPFTLTALQETPEYIECVGNDERFKTKLLIAADGANSWVRSAMNIDMVTKSYEQSALVTTVKTSLPHKKTARQCFLDKGPLAFLPLIDPLQSSIVWSTTHDHGKELAAMPEKVFCDALNAAFSHTLGDITHVTKRYLFPLQMRHVKNYVREKLALVGDAAHTVHPMAGQGVNLGLLDAATLVDTIVSAYEKKRDFASFATLRRYERSRKGDTLAMLTLVDFLNQLFCSDKKTLKMMRDIGFRLTNQSHKLKSFLTHYALGERSDLPMLASFE